MSPRAFDQAGILRGDRAEPGSLSYLVFATHGMASHKVPGIMEPFLVLSLVPLGTDGFLGTSEVD